MTGLFDHQKSVNQLFAKWELLEIELYVKREDLLHQEVSGNKLRKLKYNIVEAKRLQESTLLTYGGAYSNHIAATAAAGNLLGLSTIGIIRGEELGLDLEKTLSENSTLRHVHENGMQLQFISRSAYRKKDSAVSMRTLRETYGSFYRIPEGGTNKLAVQGTEEILSDKDRSGFDIICVAAGTGGTAAGIINSAAAHQKVIVFSALKGGFMKKEINKYAIRTDYEVVDEHSFGGYAKSDDRLIQFMNARFRESGIPLDPIYTAKMMYGIEQMIESGVINGKTRILAVHTGGLQSIAGYNKMLEKKQRLKISYENQL